MRWAESEDTERNQELVTIVQAREETLSKVIGSGTERKRKGY